MRSVRSEVIQLAVGFYGAGCLHPWAEATVAQANKMIMHYGIHSSLGHQMQISTEIILIELECTFQPFSLKYETFNDQLTHFWLKTVWKKMGFDEIDPTVHNIPLEFPRRGGK